MEADDVFSEKRLPSLLEGSGSRRKNSRFSFSFGTRRNSKRKPTIIIEDEDSFIMFNQLITVCKDNRQYFESDKSEMGHRFFNQFESMIDHLAAARRYVSEFKGFMHQYDFDDQTPGNGYRSLVNCVHSAIEYCIKVCKYIAKNRKSFLFRRSVYIQ